MIELSSARVARRTYFAVSVARAMLLLLLVSCASRDHVPPDCITPKQFVELYARLLYQREMESTHAVPPGAPRDTLSAADIARLDDFMNRADLDPATWDRLLTEVRERVRGMMGGQERGGSSAGD